MKRPTGTPRRSSPSAKRPAVTNSVWPGSITYTKHSEVIVERSPSGRVRVRTLGRGTQHFVIARGIGQVLGLGEEAVHPHEPQVDGDRRAGLAGLRVPNRPGAHTKLLRDVLDREVPRKARCAQVCPEPTDGGLHLVRRGLDDRVALCHVL